MCIRDRGVTDVDLPLVKNLLINKVESQEKNLEILEIPAEETPDKIKIYTEFNDFTTQQLNDFYNSHGSVSYTHLDVYKRQPIQTEEFVKNEISPIVEKYQHLIGLESDLKV